MQESIRLHGKGGYVDAWLFLAMTQQRLGNHQEGREWLDQFEDWLNKRAKLNNWQAKTFWRLLHQEARQMLYVMPRVAQGQ